jgi:hypothetical protein
VLNAIYYFGCCLLPAELRKSKASCLYKKFVDVKALSIKSSKPLFSENLEMTILVEGGIQHLGLNMISLSAGSTSPLQCEMYVVMVDLPIMYISRQKSGA